MHANAVTHRAAEPEQYAANVKSMAERLAQLPKGDPSLLAERKQALEANRRTPVGRSENMSAGCSDGGASSPNPNPNPNPNHNPNPNQESTASRGRHR